MSKTKNQKIGLSNGFSEAELRMLSATMDPEGKKQLKGQLQFEKSKRSKSK